jgi:hypothetical protein
MEVYMDILTKFITPGIVFFLTLVFGIWLSNAGKPYNGLLFNIHKLIALGAVVVTASQIYKILKDLEPQALIVILIIATGVCIIALFASGAFMSIGNLNYQVMKLIHNIAPVLAVIAMAVTIYTLSIIE